MDVEIIAYTPDAERVVAAAARGCYSHADSGRLIDTMKDKDVKKTLSVAHPSCFEHVSFTFAVSGISRVTSHQLVRHRLASFSQQSQRYVKPKDLNTDMLFDYVTPESVSEDDPSREQYEWAMKVINKVYKQLLGWGCPEEDARYILPNACTTNITVTMNARELQHFCGLRRCKRAQWEIRELADKMAQAAETIYPDLFEHFPIGPQCKQLGYCPEKKGCGYKPTLTELVSRPLKIISNFDLTEEDIKKMAAAMNESPPMPFSPLIFSHPIVETIHKTDEGDE